MLAEYNWLKTAASEGPIHGSGLRIYQRYGGTLEESTCGQGLAHNAVVPASLAAVASGLARNLEGHTRALDPDDLLAAREHAVYARAAASLRGAAVDLQAAAAEMAAASDLPMGAHDMAAITSLDVLDAFESYIAAEDELRRLLEARFEGNEQMLTAIRAAVGAAGED